MLGRDRDVRTVVLVPEDLVESVSDALIDELDALSVSVEDADADTDAEHALFGEPGMPAPRAGWQRSTLKALFADEAAARPRRRRCCWRRTGRAGVQRAGAARRARSQDWVRLTQSQFAPVEITPSSGSCRPGTSRRPARRG